jgi:hypothetical protein
MIPKGSPKFSSGEPMPASFDERKFNDDLLMLEADRKLAEKKFPSIFHVLDHPELRELFVQFDAPATRAKGKGLKAGLWAIGLGFCALAVAASELLVTHSIEETATARTEAWTGVVLATISGLCAFLSFLIGTMGVLSAGRKRSWLHSRLMTERTRQFHFQTLVLRLPQILASLKSDAAKTKYLSERALWFESFKGRFAGKLDSAFASTIREQEKLDVWLHDGVIPHVDVVRENKNLDSVFSAYRELRILHQLDYADYKLQDDYRIISPVPRRQLIILTQLAFTWLILLFIMHMGVLVGALLPSSFFAAFHSSSAIVIIIWLALAALATRSVEEGLQPEREIERYQQYRSAVRAILERYDDTSNPGSKLEIMREMERLVFDEMRNFLISSERARFVM